MRRTDVLGLVAVGYTYRALSGVEASFALVVAFAGLAWMVPDPVEALLGLRHPNQPIIWREEGVQT